MQKRVEIQLKVVKYVNIVHLSNFLNKILNQLWLLKVVPEWFSPHC